MFRLWCARKYHHPELKRFHFTCLYCRWRRRHYGKLSDPPFWIEYTYKSLVKTVYKRQHIRNGLLFEVSDGSPLKITKYFTVKIDPRGHFTGVRCAIIIVLDNIMKASGIRKPLAELCELFACYPTW